MELRHLRYFVAVAEELNFTRAAQRLHIAQPPLSTQIRALEDELKAPLFERHKRRVFLTPAGHHLLERARGILAAVEDARREAHDAATGEVGRVRLGYTASAMLAPALPRLLRRYANDHPAVHLQLREMTSLEQLDAVHAREIDIAVLRRPEVPLPAGLVLHEWLSTPLVVALPDSWPLAAHKTLKVRDLREQPLVAYPRESGIGLYWKVQSLCAGAGFRPRIVQEARDAATIIGLVAAGVGMAIVPDDTRCIALAGVAWRRLTDRDARSSLHLAWREEAGDRHVQGLLQRMRAAGRK